MENTNFDIEAARKNLEQWVSTTSFTAKDLKEVSDRLAKLLKKEDQATNIFRKAVAARTNKLANDVNAWIKAVILECLPELDNETDNVIASAFAKKGGEIKECICPHHHRGEFLIQVIYDKKILASRDFFNEISTITIK